MKIVFLVSRIPWPLDKGDKLRAYYQIKQLSKNHDITLIALSDISIPEGSEKELKKYCSEIYLFKLSRFSQSLNLIKAFFNKNPFQIGYFYNSHIHKNITQIINLIKPDISFIQLVRMAEYSKGIKTTKVLDYQDTLSIGLKRRAEKTKGIFKSILNIEAKRMTNYEKKVFDWFDEKIIITNTDRDLLPHPEKASIMVIQNGVDTERFVSKQTEKIYDIIFAGNMNYPPNVDAVNFLTDEIMPIIWQKYAKTKVLIAGANPASSVRQKASKRVIISGWVDDITIAYDLSKIFVAPMRIGTGLQNKLLEAMSIGIPAITTSLANEALGAKDEIQILIGNSKEEIANRIIELIENKEKYQSISSEGNRFVKENYSWDSVGKQMEDIFLKLIPKK